MWFSTITISPKKTSWNLGKLGRSSSMSFALSFLDLSKWLFFIIVFHIFPFRQFDELLLLCLLITFMPLLKSKIKFKKMFTIVMSILEPRQGSVCFIFRPVMKTWHPYVSTSKSVNTYAKWLVCVVLKMKPWRPNHNHLLCSWQIIGYLVTDSLSVINKICYL